MSTIKVEGIRLDTIIDIQVSGGFYSRLHQLLQSMAATVSPEEFQKMLLRITEGKAESALEYHIETLIVLIHEIEERAREQNKISKEDFTTED